MQNVFHQLACSKLMILFTISNGASCYVILLQQWLISYYYSRRGYVFVAVCVSVCKISQKVMNRFLLHFLDGCYPWPNQLDFGGNLDLGILKEFFKILKEFGKILTNFIYDFYM